MAKYVCTLCGYVYDEAVEGKAFTELESDYACPICGVSADMFEKTEE